MCENVCLTIDLSSAKNQEFGLLKFFKPGQNLVVELGFLLPDLVSYVSDSNC